MGFLCVLISSFFSWIWMPITEYHESIPVNEIALFISIISLVSFVFPSGSVLSISGVLGLGLFSFSLFHLAFEDSTFWTLVDQNEQYVNMMEFSREISSTRIGVEPDLLTKLPMIEPFLDPLSTALYFVRWSGWLCLAGSLLLIFEGFRMKGRAVLKWTGASALVVLGVVGITHFDSLTAQYYWARGRHQTAIGQYAQAVQKYRTATKWSPLIEKNEQFHLDWGAAYNRMGYAVNPHVRFYIGDIYNQQNRLDDALFEYNLVENNPKSSWILKEIVKKRIARTLVKKGLDQYKDGQINKAIETWEEVLPFDYNQVQAAYFISQGYFQEGRYEKSIAIGQYLLSQSTNRLLNAHIQANIGDGYWKLNDTESARRAYQASKAFASSGNFRVLENLGGGTWGM